MFSEVVVVVVVMPLFGLSVACNYAYQDILSRLLCGMQISGKSRGRGCCHLRATVRETMGIL